MGQHKRWTGWLAGIVSMLATPAHADIAYGIAMAADPALYGCVADKQSSSIFNCLNVPYPDSRMVLYGVQAFPGTGICWLKAVSRPEEADLMGQSIRATTDLFAAELARKYGRPQELADFVRSGTTADETWLETLIQKDREYYHHWTSVPADAQARSIKEIYVSAFGLADGRTAVHIEYYLANYDACLVSEMKGQAK